MVAPAPTALVTGAAQRIGRALALDLAAHGWRIGLHCHTSVDQAESLAGEIKAMGGVAIVLKADLTDIAAVEQLVPRCAAALGAPTCLVNNASMFIYDDIATLDPKIWDAQLAVNLRAPVFLAKAFAASLPAGAAGQRHQHDRPACVEADATLLLLRRLEGGLVERNPTLAQALAPRVRVNAIGPGPVLKSAHQTEEEFRRQCEATILRRGTTPQEIASAVRFILDAPAMTGQMIALDGGQHLAWETPDIKRAPRG